MATAIFPLFRRKYSPEEATVTFRQTQVMDHAGLCKAALVIASREMLDTIMFPVQEGGMLIIPIVRPYGHFELPK